MQSTSKYSVVIPIHDEESTLPELGRQLTRVIDDLDGAAEVILVDDGSRDRSYELIQYLCAADPRFKALRLSRNFGHQIAITAGLDVAQGEAVIVMDADLQHPPEVIHELIQRWKEGYQVVYGVMSSRNGESRLKVMTAKLFYRFLRRMARINMPAAAGDFRLIDRQALEAFNLMRESNRYVRGMFAWIGFRQIGITYSSRSRYAGQTKYTYSKMLKLATDALLSFSQEPLRVVLKLGFAASGLAFIFGLVTIATKIAGVFNVPGYVTIVFAVTFIGGVQLVVLGVIGEYLARVFEEVKGRPLYFVAESQGIAVRSHGRRDQVPADVREVSGANGTSEALPLEPADDAVPARKL